MVDLKLSGPGILGSSMAAKPDNRDKASPAAPSGSAKAAETERLAEALRDNLRRRKAQERGRRAAATTDTRKLPH
jgi:hypothetical protein